MRDQVADPRAGTRSRGSDPGAQREQVRVLDLRIDQRPAPVAQPCGQRRQRHLGAARFGAEHALAEEHAADRDAVDAADQACAVEHLDAVRVPEPMQLA